MERKKILDAENGVTQMDSDDQFLYILSKRVMYKYDLKDMSLIAQNTLVKKDGKERDFAIFGDLIFFRDFLDLYILNKEDLQLKDALRLGEDLSSDIGGVMWFDAPKAYVRVRNGWIYVLDINTKEVEKVQISDSSFWGWCVTENVLYAGTVNGELLEVEKKTLNILRKIQLHRKNIYGVIYEDGLLYTVSQDQHIKITDAASFKAVCASKKANFGMVRHFGLHEDSVIVRGSKCPLSAWDKKTLQPLGSIDIPIGLKLHDGKLLVSDNQGVYEIIE
jgi:hypothetical protein